MAPRATPEERQAVLDWWNNARDSGVIEKIRMSGTPDQKRTLAQHARTVIAYGFERHRKGEASSDLEAKRQILEEAGVLRPKSQYTESSLPEDRGIMRALGAGATQGSIAGTALNRFTGGGDYFGKYQPQGAGELLAYGAGALGAALPEFVLTGGLLGLGTKAVQAGALGAKMAGAARTAANVAQAARLTKGAQMGGTLGAHTAVSMPVTMGVNEGRLPTTREYLGGIGHSAALGGIAGGLAGQAGRLSKYLELPTELGVFAADPVVTQGVTDPAQIAAGVLPLAALSIVSRLGGRPQLPAVPEKAPAVNLVSRKPGLIDRLRGAERVAETEARIREMNAIQRPYVETALAGREVDFPRPGQAIPATPEFMQRGGFDVRRVYQPELPPTAQIEQMRASLDQLQEARGVIGAKFDEAIANTRKDDHTTRARLEQTKKASFATLDNKIESVQGAVDAEAAKIGFMRTPEGIVQGISAAYDRPQGKSTKTGRNKILATPEMQRSDPDRDEGPVLAAQQAAADAMVPGSRDHIKQLNLIEDTKEAYAAKRMQAVAKASKTRTPFAPLATKRGIRAHEEEQLRRQQYRETPAIGMGLSNDYESAKALVDEIDRKIDTLDQEHGHPGSTMPAEDYARERAALLASRANLGAELKWAVQKRLGDDIRLRGGEPLISRAGSPPQLTLPVERTHAPERGAPKQGVDPDLSILDRLTGSPTSELSVPAWRPMGQATVLDDMDAPVRTASVDPLAQLRGVSVPPEQVAPAAFIPDVRPQAPGVEAALGDQISVPDRTADRPLGVGETVTVLPSVAKGRPPYTATVIGHTASGQVVVRGDYNGARETVSAAEVLRGRSAVSEEQAAAPRPQAPPMATEQAGASPPQQQVQERSVKLVGKNGTKTDARVVPAPEGQETPDGKVWVQVGSQQPVLVWGSAEQAKKGARYIEETTPKNPPPPEEPPPPPAPLPPPTPPSGGGGGGRPLAPAPAPVPAPPPPEAPTKKTKGTKAETTTVVPFAIRIPKEEEASSVRDQIEESRRSQEKARTEEDLADQEDEYVSRIEDLHGELDSFRDTMEEYRDAIGEDKRDLREDYESAKEEMSDALVSYWEENPPQVGQPIESWSSKDLDWVGLGPVVEVKPDGFVVVSGGKGRKKTVHIGKVRPVSSEDWNPFDDESVPEKPPAPPITPNASKKPDAPKGGGDLAERARQLVMAGTPLGEAAKQLGLKDPMDVMKLVRQAAERATGGSGETKPPPPPERPSPDPYDTGWAWLDDHVAAIDRRRKLGPGGQFEAERPVGQEASEGERGAQYDIRDDQGKLRRAQTFAEQMNDEAVMLAYRIVKSGQEFGSWAGELRTRFGAEIEGYLQAIWDRAVRLTRDLRGVPHGMTPLERQHWLRERLDEGRLIGADRFDAKEKFTDTPKDYIRRYEDRFGRKLTKKEKHEAISEHIRDKATHDRYISIVGPEVSGGLRAIEAEYALHRGEVPEDASWVAKARDKAEKTLAEQEARASRAIRAAKAAKQEAASAQTLAAAEKERIKAEAAVEAAEKEAERLADLSEAQQELAAHYEEVKGQDTDVLLRLRDGAAGKVETNLDWYAKYPTEGAARDVSRSRGALANIDRVLSDRGVDRQKVASAKEAVAREERLAVWRSKADEELAKELKSAQHDVEYFTAKLPSEVNRGRAQILADDINTVIAERAETKDSEAVIPDEADGWLEKSAADARERLLDPDRMNSTPVIDYALVIADMLRHGIKSAAEVAKRLGEFTGRHVKPYFEEAWKLAKRITKDAGDLSLDIRDQVEGRLSTKPSDLGPGAQSDGENPTGKSFKRSNPTGVPKVKPAAGPVQPPPPRQRTPMPTVQDYQRRGWSAKEGEFFSVLSEQALADVRAGTDVVGTKKATSKDTARARGGFLQELKADPLGTIADRVWKENLADRVFRYKQVEDFLVGIDTTRATARKTELLRHESPHKEARAVARSAGVAKGMIDYGIHDPRDPSKVSSYRDVFDPFKKALLDRENGGSMVGRRRAYNSAVEKFEDLLIARTMLDRRKLEQPTPYDAIPDGFSKLERLVKALDQHPVYKLALERFRSFEDALLDYVEGHGLYNKEQIAAMRAAHADHAPIYYIIAPEVFGAPRGTRQLPFTRARGSSEGLILSPLASVVKNTVSVAKKSLYNTTNSKLVDLWDKADPEKRKVIMEEITEETKYEPSKADLDAAAKGIGYEDAADAIGRLGRGDKDIGLAHLSALASTMKEATGARDDRNVLVVYQNGKPRRFYVRDQRLYETAMEMRRKSDPDGAIGKLMASVAGVIRTGAVMHPAFALSNFPADVQNYQQVDPALGHSVLGFASAVRKIASVIKEDETYRNFVANGGSMASLTVSGRGTVDAPTMKMIGKNPLDLRHELSPGEAAQELSAHLLSFIKFRQISQISEEAPRVAVFEAAVKELMSPKFNELRRKDGLKPLTLAEAQLEAGHRAADVLDFASGGRASKELSQYAPFFNIVFVGIDKANREMSKAFRGDPGKRDTRSLQRFATHVVLPAMALWAYNAMDSRWESVTDQEKRQNWIFMPWWDKTAQPIRIRKSHYLGEIGATGLEIMLDQMFGTNKRAKERLIKLGIGAVNSPAPAAWVLPFELLAGERGYSSFRQGQIVPEELIHLSPEQRYNERTSEAAKALGKIPLPIVGKTAPVKWDYLFGQLGGGLGTQWVVPAAEKLTGKQSLLHPIIPDERHAASPPSALPVVGRLFSRSGPGGASQIVDNFYADRARVKQLVSDLARMRTRIVEAAPKERTALIDEYRGMVASAETKQAEAALPRMDSIAESIKSINQTIKMIDTNKSLTPQERAKQIAVWRARREALARRGLDSRKTKSN